jgi:hypothetical protein
MNSLSALLGNSYHVGITQQVAEECIIRWFDSIKSKVSLFQLKPNSLALDLDNDDGENRILRSRELSVVINNIRKRVLDPCDQESESPLEGILYLIYRRDNMKSVIPLYVGISQKKGKTRAVSTLFENGWMRFDDRFNTKGHIGNINDCVFKGNSHYSDWVEEMIDNDNLFLKTPIYVHIQEWDSSAHSIFPILGHTPIYLEEMIRIWFLQIAGRSAFLLNKEGNR